MKFTVITVILTIFAAFCCAKVCRYDEGRWYIECEDNSNANCIEGSEVFCVLEDDSCELGKEAKTGWKNESIFEQRAHWPCANIGVSAEGTSALALGAGIEDEDGPDNMRASHKFLTDDMRNATHLVFQITSSEYTPGNSIPTLIVEIGGTTVMILPITDDRYFNEWTLINVTLPDSVRQPGIETTVSFQLVSIQSFYVLIDTVRFVRYSEGSVPFSNFTTAEGECSPGCNPNEINPDVYNVACDNIACDFNSSVTNFADQFKFKATPSYGVCYNMRKPGRVFYEGSCSSIYFDKSCCTSKYDDYVAYNKALDKLYNEDGCKITGDCKDYIEMLRCAACDGSSSLFMDKDTLLPKICYNYARKIIKACKKDCSLVTAEDFFDAYNLGFVVKNERDYCFNGRHTGEFFLFDYEIALIAIGSVIFVCVIALVIAFSIVKGRKYAKKVDDKIEPETCVVAPESVVDPATLGVEMDSTTSMQPMQPMDANSLAQTQQMVMMEDSLAMNSQMQMMMMPSLMQTQNGMQMQSGMPMQSGMQGGLDPSLMQTQGGVDPNLMSQ